MTKKNVGIIGFGSIGKVHAFGYATLPFYTQPLGCEFKVTHVATAHASTAEKAKSITGAEFATTDYREITENPDVDIVHICTPNEQHLAPLISAIENNKHIYCEKPLCVNSVESQCVLDAINRCGYSGTSQLTFHLRFFPSIMRMKQMLEQEQLGRILQFR
ncbi:MAG: Gfo/Idh/MocA family protein, partial [Thermoguttaceae bacterium]